MRFVSIKEKNAHVLRVMEMLPCSQEIYTIQYEKSEPRLEKLHF